MPKIYDFLQLENNLQLRIPTVLEIHVEDLAIGPLDCEP